MSPEWPEADPWPVSVERLASHLRTLRRAVDDSARTGSPAVRRAALLVYDWALDDATKMLGVDAPTSRPLGDPMAQAQRQAVEVRLAEAGVDVQGEPARVVGAGWASAVGGRFRVWAVLRTDEAGGRYLNEAAAYVEALPDNDWRLEALDYLRTQGQHWLSHQEPGESFAIFTGEGAQAALLNVGVSWTPASFDELLADLVVHEAQDLRWRDDL